MAVGTGGPLDDGNDKPIAETYNGQAWTLHAPLTVGRETQLAAVDCTSATFCTAVGSDAKGPVAERWNGKTWRVETPVRPGSSTDTSGFAGVSCSTNQSCVAVGSVTTRSEIQSAFAETWRGDKRGWELTPTPNLSSYQGVALEAVSCVAVSHCVAVGGKINNLAAGEYRNLVETWNGTTWSLTSAPSPAGDTSLDGITCRTRTWCLAVGTTIAGGGEPTTLELRGTKWTARAVTIKTGGFTSVACRSTTSCLAAGAVEPSTTSEPLIAHWNGSGWAKRTVDQPASQDTQLSGVSCLSASSCYAAGSYVQSGTGSTDAPHVLVEHGSSN